MGWELWGVEGGWRQSRARRQLRVGKTIDASCPALASLLRSRLAPLPAAQVRSCNTAGLSVQGRSALSATYVLLLPELSVHIFTMSNCYVLSSTFS